MCGGVTLCVWGGVTVCVGGDPVCVGGGGGMGAGALRKSCSMYHYLMFFRCC